MKTGFDDAKNPIGSAPDNRVTSRAGFAFPDVAI